MTEIIKISNLSKVYNPDTVPVHAVKNIDLSIGVGEFTAIVGPSGSGKSTLLNLVGGLDVATTGNVWIDEVDIMKLSENELINFRLNNIGFVFQAYNLIPVLSAKENVEFIMLLQKRPQAEIDTRVSELLTAVGLGDRMKSRPTELSGGQQQRVAVARALASKPKFVLADEPTANLDTQSAESLLDIMETLNREEGMTFLFSTHDQRVVNRARRVVNLVDGSIESDILK